MFFWNKYDKELEQGKHGMFKPLKTNEYYFVKVGGYWVTGRWMNESELSEDFRRARAFVTKHIGVFPPQRNLLTDAFAKAKQYGGKVVRVTVSIDEVEESDIPDAEG